MVAHPPLALPSVAFNEDQAIVYKSCKAVRRIENAGFACYLASDWNLIVKYSDVFNPSKIHDVAKETRDTVEAFLQSGYADGSDAIHTYTQKREWAKLLSAVNQKVEGKTRSDSESEEETKISRGNSRKCLGLVRDFVSKNQNAYELLNVRESDDLSKIKANYKKIVLLLHPDKAANTKVPEDFVQYAAKYRIHDLRNEERRQQFILLQDAFTVLSDPELRHEYDCNLPFDESVPTKEDAKAASDFFALFGPVFELNSRWSRTKPVPSLGTAESNDEDVDAFYDFWRGFETTRTFSHAAPHLLDDAESREEKRWMERENQKVQKKLVKTELVRIQKLVDLAQAFDPRIKARAERKRLDRLEKQRLMEEQKLREIREKQEAEERQRDELLRLQSRERFEKQIVKKLRQHLRGISNKLEKGTELSQNFDRLSELDYNFVKESCQSIYKLLGHETELEGSDESLQFVKRMDSIVKAAVINEEAPFEEVLQKVSEKISPPTGEIVTEMPVHKQETQKEEDAVEWTPEELSRLSKAVEIHVAGVSNRWSLIAKHVKTKTLAQCLHAAREMAAGRTVPLVKTVSTTNVSKDSSKALKDCYKATSNDTGDAWNAEQQAQLERALAKYPPSMDAVARWRMIASEVQGKNAKECLARFKMIKATIASTTRN